jgi:hypothetical protein
MSTPPAPPAPPGTDPPPPTPPAPTPPAPPPAPPSGGPTAEDVAKLTASLEQERQQRIDLKKELDKLKAEGMSEAEKAIAKAREEGKAEAAQEHALSLAAAEFRVQAAGKITNPDAALAVLDLSKLLKDGAPDKSAIGKLVDQLAAVPPPPGRVPPGPRDPGSNGATDFFRETLRGQR